MGLGAAVGAAIWLGVGGATKNLDLFLCIVIAAWCAIGISALVQGQVVIAGRDGKSPRAFTGTSARLIGLVIIAILIAFTFTMLQTGSK